MISLFKIVQINLHHCKAATADINRLLKMVHTYKVALIQEPWVHGTALRGIGGLPGDVFIGASGTEIPRAVVYAFKNLNALQLTQFNSRDLVAVLIDGHFNGCKRKIIFASAYKPNEYDVLPPSNEIMNLVQFATVTETPLILGCDANSHHLVWGSTNINPRGEALLSYIASTNLQILNSGNEPTFVTRSRS